MTDTIGTAGFTEVPIRVFGLVNIMQGVPRAEVVFLCSSLPLRISAQMDGSAKPDKPFVSGSSRNKSITCLGTIGGSNLPKNLNVT